MPIYEYFCQDCDHEFEEIVFGNELPSCPECQAKQCQKLISRPSKRRSSSSGARDADVSGMTSPPSSKSKCSGCSGGNCATC